jgi:hypothetical protein
MRVVSFSRKRFCEGAGYEAQFLGAELPGPWDRCDAGRGRRLSFGGPGSRPRDPSRRPSAHAGKRAATTASNCRGRAEAAVISARPESTPQTGGRPLRPKCQSRPFCCPARSCESHRSGGSVTRLSAPSAGIARPDKQRKLVLLARWRALPCLAGIARTWLGLARMTRNARGGMGGTQLRERRGE